MTKMVGWRKRFEGRFLRVLSRHPSHNVLRLKIPVTKPTVLRLGSTNEKGVGVQLNTVESIQNCSNKLRMKEIFKEAGVQSPAFFTETPEMTKHGILAKKFFRSRGQGMKKFDDQESLNEFGVPKGYYFEEYKNYSREYRIHCSKLGGYFYSCRKMLKEEATNRWFRNDSNCTWILEGNELFDKPKTWDAIVADCQKAREALGLSICCFDIRTNKEGNWMIIEANSAPSFGNITTEKYIEELTKICAD